jgi:hypothetical protein
MRPLLLGLALGLVLSSVGCDSGPGSDEPTIPDIDEVRLEFSENGDAVQTAWARREEDGSINSQGRLFLPPGQHAIRLQAYEEDESVTEYLVNGPDSPLLRFKFGGKLAGRITLVGSTPDAAPLDTIYAPLERAGPSPKTSPLPQPDLILEVKDTTKATGTLRLVLERYENYREYRTGSDPLRVDFDISVSLRTLPAIAEGERTRRLPTPAR